jgi:hypothetical protein
MPIITQQKIVAILIPSLPCPFISTDIKYTTHNNIERDINNVATKSFELSLFDVYGGIDDVGVGSVDIPSIPTVFCCGIGSINLYFYL